ncbi:MAG TPA: hypothetical protein PLL66_00485, partial [Bacteroidales bacterium]|nr:hypothetical protein [Bacteroidales bacterium]
MKQILSFCFLVLFVGGYLLSQPIVQFDKTYGGSGCEDGRSAKQTPDGGYVMMGRTDSYGAGLNDIYLVKTDENGDVLWTKTYGGMGEEKIGWAMKHNIILTKDGGFVIVGYTNSYGNGDYDIFLIKTDINGDTLWTKTY